MTKRDDAFEPRLGRISARDTDLRSHYLRDINRDIARAGRRHGASGSRRAFHGSRIGRGAGVGSVLASRDRYAAFRTRRVVIKTLHRAMAREGLSRGDADFAVYDPLAPDVRQLVGRVVAGGLSDEMDDRHYLVLDGVDGRQAGLGCCPGWTFPGT